MPHGGGGYQTQEEMDAARAAYKKYGPGGAYDYTNHPGAAATPGTPEPTSFQSTATDDPRMVEAYNALKGRMSVDNTKRAIDRSNLATMDAAALGAADAKGSLSARGALGTGTGATFVNRNITQPAVREAAGKAADISLGREKDLDSLAAALSPAAGAIAGNNLAQRQFGLSQWEAQQADAARRAAMEQQQRNQELANLMAITQMMGDFGSTFPGGIQAPPVTTGPYTPRAQQNPLQAKGVSHGGGGGLYA